MKKPQMRWLSYTIGFLFLFCLFFSNRNDSIQANKFMFIMCSTYKIKHLIKHWRQESNLINRSATNLNKEQGK